MICKVCPTPEERQAQVAEDMKVIAVLKEFGMSRVSMAKEIVRLRLVGSSKAEDAAIGRRDADQSAERPNGGRPSGLDGRRGNDSGGRPPSREIPRTDPHPRPEFYGIPGHCISIDGEWWHEPGKCPGAIYNCTGECCGVIRPADHTGLSS